ELTAGLSEAQFNWRPDPTRWSIEECLAHMIMVGQVQIASLDEAIAKGQARGLKSRGPFHYGNIDRFFYSLIEPPVKAPFPAPKQFIPLHGQPVTAVLPTFDHVQTVFLNLL